MREIDIFTSSKILEVRCELWFEKRFSTRPWFPTREGTLRSFRPKTSVVDAVLFGGFVRQLWDSRHWPKNCEYRLWTLCEGARDVVVDLMGLREDSVGVVPRYALFPLRARPKAFPPANQRWTLVFAGRLIEFKYVEMILRVVSFLQTVHEEPVDLVFYGSFITEQARARFWYLFHTLSWKSPPRVLKPSSPELWTKTRHRNPVFCTFSKFEKEDFGVSVAQAQSAGWPLILSDWGGHRDVEGGNVIRVPPRLIADFDADVDLQIRSAEKIARYLVGALEQTRSRGIVASQKSANPRMIPHAVPLKELRSLDLGVHGALYGKSVSLQSSRAIKKKYLKLFGDG